MLNISAVHDPLFCIAWRPVLDTLPANDLGIMNILCPFCDALHWVDEHVSSLRAGHPEFGTCCTYGKVKLPPLHVPPALYIIYSWQIVLKPKNFEQISCNTMWHWHLHL